MLGFFHQQMAVAVRKRYLQDDRRAEADVCSRLGDYFVRKADPTGGGRWEGESGNYFADLVYYQLRALRVRGNVCLVAWSSQRRLVHCACGD